MQHANEQQQIQTVTLRYGMFYGAESAATRYMIGQLRKRRVPLVGGAHGLASLVQIEDAAAATVAALERGRPGAIYNIADDEPVDFNGFIVATAATVGAPRPFAVPGWLLRLAAQCWSIRCRPGCPYRMPARVASSNGGRIFQATARGCCS